MSRRPRRALLEDKHSVDQDTLQNRTGNGLSPSDSAHAVGAVQHRQLLPEHGGLSNDCVYATKSQQFARP